MSLFLYCKGNTGEAYGSAGSDSDFNEDEAEEREAALLQQRHLDFIQEEDFRDTFALPAPQQKPKVRVWGIKCTVPTFLPVFRSRIRRILMFMGLPYPSIIKLK
jgi:hypothetical protein